MGILSKLFGTKDDAPEDANDFTINTDILDRGRENVNNFFIAGLAHHCTRKDVGFFTGMVFNEKSNSVNKKAMAVLSHQTNKIIGYVPESILDNYRMWCKDKHICIGYVFFDGEHLLGRARTYKPGIDQNLMTKDIEEYARQACGHFGWQVPNFTTD